MDVVGLYPHIPHSEALKALRLAMEKAEGDMPVDDLVSLAKLVLENNFFELDENEFRQRLGTAIGTKFGLLASLRPWVRVCFLDNVFMIRLHGEDKLNDFLAKLNSFHESIKFTWKIGLQEIAFLDVWITKVNSVFHTDVYSKPTKDVHHAVFEF